MAMNGAQIKSLLDIVGQVARQEIPRESGVEALIIAFPTITRETADRLLGPTGTPEFNPGDAPEEPAAPEGAPPGGMISG